MKMQVTKYMAIELTEPNELIELISEDDKVDFMQSLSCHDVIIEYVADQIISGCTADGYSGSETMISESPSTPLQKARREIALNANDVAKKEIKDLERALKQYKDSCDYWQKKFYDLRDKVGI